jgi:ribonuclease D
MPDSRQSIQSPASAPQWVRTPEELRALTAVLAGGRIIALDSESDSLHSFPEKVCMVQVADERGAVSLVDPLALRDLSPLAAPLADPAAVKIFHGASYDLSSMKRDFGFTFAGIFDTMVAAQFLGLPALGLASLLERFFGIAPGRSRQKDDWAKRPLTPEQESYAAEDVRHLIPLRERLLVELRKQGREAWVEEECQALAAVAAAQRIFDPEDYVHVKGAKNLDRRGLAVLRDLFVAREAWAWEAGRPPFKVLGNESLVHLAADRPRSREGLQRIPGCSPKVVQRYGDGLLAAIARADAIPEEELPTHPRPKRPRIPAAVQRRIEALTRWRVATADRLGLDPGLLLPRRLIEHLAEQIPADRETLGKIEGLRRWRAETFGQEVLEILAATPSPDRPRRGSPSIPPHPPLLPGTPGVEEGRRKG